MRGFRATKLLACVSSLAIACALGSEHARAHTVSIGYAFSGPGAVTLWYGSYHDDATFNEADVQLVGPSYNNTVIYTLLSATKPTGLVDGVNNFYSNTAGTALVGVPQLVNSTDGSGGHFDPTTDSILNWQGARFTGLRVGTYTFTYNPLAIPTVEWHPINDVIRTNSFTLTMADVLGITGFTPYSKTQNQRSVANGMDTSISGGGFNQKFFDIAALPASQLPNALTQLSAEPLTQTAQAGFQSMNAFLATMLDPWSGAGGMDPRGGDFGAFGFPGGGIAPGDPSSLYSNAPYGTAPYGTSPYGNSPYGNAPYGNAPYGSSPYGNSPYGNSPYGNSQYGNSPYGNSPYGNSPYGNSPYGQSQNTNPNAANARPAPRGFNANCSPVPDGRTQPCWSIWATPYGAYNTMAGNQWMGSHDTTVKSGGMISGLDYRYGPGGVVGAAVAAGTTWWGLSDNLGGGRSDSFQVGAYASQRVNSAYLSAAMAFGWQQVSTDRTVTISGSDQLHGGFSAKGFGARAEAGNRFEYYGTGLTPYVAAQIQTWRLPAYTEAAVSGSNDFAVAVDARKANETRTEVGLWADRRVETDSGPLLLRGRMAWLHEFRTSPTIDAAFPALPNSNFVVTGTASDPNALLVSFGSELRLAGGWSVGTKFDSELAEHSKTFAGNGTVRYRW